jgi:hypothetical protein
MERNESEMWAGSCICFAADELTPVPRHAQDNVWFVHAYLEILGHTHTKFGGWLFNNASGIEIA